MIFHKKLRKHISGLIKIKTGLYWPYGSFESSPIVNHRKMSPNMVAWAPSLQTVDGIKDRICILHHVYNNKKELNSSDVQINPRGPIHQHYGPVFDACTASLHGFAEGHDSTKFAYVLLLMETRFVAVLIHEESVEML